MPLESVKEGAERHQAAQALVDDLARIISGDVFASAIVERLGEASSASAGQIQSQIAGQESHRLVRLSVTQAVNAEASSEEIEAVKDEVLHLAHAVQAELEENDTYWLEILGGKGAQLSLVDRPDRPAGPDQAGLRRRIEIPLRVVLALLIGLGMTLVLHSLDPRLFEDQEVRRASRAAILARIPAPLFEIARGIRVIDHLRFEARKVGLAPMDMLALSRMLIRRSWIPILLAVLGALAATLFALSRQPRYEATTRLRLELAQPADFGQTQAAKDLLASVVEDIRVHDMADATAVRLGESWFSDQQIDADHLHTMLYAGDLRVGADSNVYEIQVKARHEEPAIAEAISRQWSETYIDRRNKQNKLRPRRDRVEVAFRDETRSERYSPRRKLLVALGALAGIALGGLLMLTVEYLESAVFRNAEEFKRRSDLVLLGSVPATGREPKRRGPVLSALLNLIPMSLGLLKTIWPILALGLIGATSGLAYSQMQTQIYRARARIALEPANTSNWGNAQAIRETMRGFKEDIRTRRMAQMVNERLQLDVPAEYLLDGKRMNVAEDVGVFEIRIDFFHSNPEIARSISRTWAEVFIEDHRVDDLKRDQPDRILTRLRDEVIDAIPWSPKHGINALVGAAIGILVGLAWFWARGFLMRGLIRTSADLEDWPLLAIIPPAKARQGEAS